MWLDISESGLAGAATNGQSFGLTAVRGLRDLRTLNALSFNQLSPDERLQLLSDSRTPTPEWNPDGSEAREAQQEDEIRLGENPSPPSTSQSLTSANSSARTLLAAALHRSSHYVPDAADIIGSIEGAGKRLGAKIRQLGAKIRQNIIDDLTDIRSEVDLIARSIGYVESRGRYNVIGPRTRDGDHAYGKYQVMGKYVGAWTEKAIGRRLTPQEFLNNPKAQDAVAHQRMGDLYRRHGTLQDVAAVWFSGRPLRHNTSRDVTGVSVPLYAQLAQAHHDRLVEAMSVRGIQLASFEPTKPAGAKSLHSAGASPSTPV